VTGGARYFAADAEARATVKASFVAWDGVVPVEIASGLRFQPVLGDGLMVNFVHFEPNTEAPLHWHGEEQISFVVDGELEFEAGGERRTLRRGKAVVIPPNVPHAARTRDGSCFAVDIFHPPRRGLLEAMGLSATDAEAGARRTPGSRSPS
jgi:quercetin dioxygenase-like cupin family protein